MNINLIQKFHLKVAVIYLGHLISGITSMELNRMRNDNCVGVLRWSDNLCVNGMVHLSNE